VTEAAVAPPGASAASDPCAACGLCCRTYLVPVTGLDVWRISRGLGTEPADWLAAWPEGDPSPEGFILQSGGSSFRLVLQKQGSLTPGVPCIFLAPAGDGTSRCGIYAHRPETCRAYPMVKRPEGVVVHPEAVCPPNSWPDGRSQSLEWLPTINLLQSDLQTYRGVVAAWNQQVRSDRGAVRSLEEFCQFLLDSYEPLRPYDRLPAEPA
jgi:Fe-S-cluster containining protein